MHVLGVCDVATLQIRYDIAGTRRSQYSTCLDLATVLTLSRSASSVPYGGTVTFTAVLEVVTDADYGRLSGNPVSRRTDQAATPAAGHVHVDHVATMPPTSPTGTYVTALRLYGSAEFRAVFSTPTDEGLRGDSSPAVSGDRRVLHVGALARMTHRALTGRKAAPMASRSSLGRDGGGIVGAAVLAARRPRLRSPAGPAGAARRRDATASPLRRLRGRRPPPAPRPVAHLPSRRRAGMRRRMPSWRRRAAIRSPASSGRSSGSGPGATRRGCRAPRSRSAPASR